MIKRNERDTYAVTLSRLVATSGSFHSVRADTQGREACTRGRCLRAVTDLLVRAMFVLRYLIVCGIPPFMLSRWLDAGTRRTERTEFFSWKF